MMLVRHALLVFMITQMASLTKAQMPGDVLKIFKQYCFDCHDETTKEGSLSLEALLTDEAVNVAPNVAASIPVWTRIHDRVAVGEMPPHDALQPPAAERASLVDWVRRTLHDTSLEAQRQNGRSTIRRMNRIEYEHTLQDLLNISVNIKDLLPEDATVAGFDNVSHGLGISSEHLVRYQQAADKAIKAAIAFRGESSKQRTTASQRWNEWRPADRADQRESADLHQRYSARLVGDSVVFHQQTDSNGFLEFEAGTPSVPGRYRLRARVSAVNSQGKPLPVLVFRVGIPREFNVNNARVVAVRDAPAGEPAIIEQEFTVTDDPNVSLERRIALKGWSLPWQKHPDDIRKDIAAGVASDFSGPGLAIEWVELEGPLGEAIGYERLFGDLPRDDRGQPDSSDPKSDADRLIRRLLPVAFRRPVDEATAMPFVEFAHERLDQGYSFVDAMTAAYRNVFCSPRFLMLIERPGTLDDYAIATRLSYFLWSSCPDQELLTRAAKGELAKPAVLEAEVDRMLLDRKASRFTENFVGQWLDLRKLHMTKPDLRYVEFDDQLLWSMPRETMAYFDEMLRHNRSVSELVSSDWTYLDARLAKHYGVSGVDSWELTRSLLLPEHRRGGVITHASVLKVTANGTTTSPVLRGKWLLEKIIGKPPSPPPPDIPALEPDIRGATTIRQQLEKHRQLPACASCHLQIDPPGFALENYDVIGGWRDWYRGSQDGHGGKEQVELVNYSGTRVWRGEDVKPESVMRDGRAFKDIDQYRAILLEDPEQLARSVTTKLLVYATGTDSQFADREVVDSIIDRTRGDGFGLRAILHGVIQSRCFLNK
jgi:mono/diheme cytochrome c family protein